MCNPITFKRRATCFTEGWKIAWTACRKALCRKAWQPAAVLESARSIWQRSSPITSCSIFQKGRAEHITAPWWLLLQHQDGQAEEDAGPSDIATLDHILPLRPLHQAIPCNLEVLPKSTRKAGDKTLQNLTVKNAMLATSKKYFALMSTCWQMPELHMAAIYIYFIYYMNGYHIIYNRI